MLTTQKKEINENTLTKSLNYKSKHQIKYMNYYTEEFQRNVKASRNTQSTNFSKSKDKQKEQISDFDSLIREMSRF